MAAATSTLTMIHLPASLAAGYGRYQPRSELLLVDFSRVPDRGLRRAATTSFGKLALLLLKHGRETGLIEQVRNSDTGNRRRLPMPPPIDLLLV